MQLDLLNYRRRLEAEKQEYFETIAMINDHLKLKSHLINQITHDIKNQLSPVVGYADVILTNLSTLKLEEEKEKLIRKPTDTIKKHSERIEQQLQDLLNDIKQESKKRLLNLETLAGDVVCYNYDNAKLKHQEIEFESQKDLPVEGRKYDLMSAMDNLIGNAMKYSPENTKIRVSVEKDADFVYFKVRDQGPGLTEEQKEKFKTDPANVGNKPTGGETPNGIGARTIITVIENHEGELIIESEPGNGAAFIMKLPAAFEDINQPET